MLFKLKVEINVYFNENIVVHILQWFDLSIKYDIVT